MRLRKLFSADLRSLAALRIVLGCLVLLDLTNRAGDLRAHYTDAGVLPRSVVAEGGGLLDPAYLAASLVGGDAQAQARVFVVGALAAFALLIGYRTRAATFVTWLVVMYLQRRNPFVLGGGEDLLRLLLMWGLFLPLGARWSVDRRQGRSTEIASPFLSAAVVGLFLQIVFVYWFAVLLKTAPEWRFDGTAIYYALSLDQLATPLGRTLLQFPALLSALTYGTLALEALGPLLLLSPVFTAAARTLAVAAFASLHIGIWLTLGLGNFPLLSALCMVAFLPAAFWDDLAASGMPRPLAWLRRRHLGGARWRAGFDWLTAGGPSPTRAPAAGRIRGRRLSTSRPVNVLASVILVCILLWNITTVSTLRLPKPIAAPAELIGLGQTWNMFAPGVVKDDGWYVIPGALASGRTVDLAGVLRDDDALRPVSWARPPDLRATYKNEHWRKYLEVLRTRRPEQHANLGRYICSQWNAEHRGAQRLVAFEIDYVGEETLPASRPPKPRVRSLWGQGCA